MSQGAQRAARLNSSPFAQAKTTRAVPASKEYPSMTAAPPQYFPRMNWARDTGRERLMRTAPRRTSEETATEQMKRVTKVPARAVNQ